MSNSAKNKVDKNRQDGVFNETFNDFLRCKKVQFSGLFLG